MVEDVLRPNIFRRPFCSFSSASSISSLLASIQCLAQRISGGWAEQRTPAGLPVFDSPLVVNDGGHRGRELLQIPGVEGLGKVLVGPVRKFERAVGPLGQLEELEGIRAFQDEVCHGVVVLPIIVDVVVPVGLVLAHVRGQLSVGLVANEGRIRCVRLPDELERGRLREIGPRVIQVSPLGACGQEREGSRRDQ
eukprot:scaffold1291_cov256-Pinguiococcus_pyrenoidosus.AAC.7